MLRLTDPTGENERSNSVHDLLSSSEKMLEAPIGFLNPSDENDCTLEVKKVPQAEPETASISTDASVPVWKTIGFCEEAVRAMVKIIEIRDPYTASHQVRVSRISVEIAGAMGLSPARIKGVQLAALIHDIGKLAIPQELLNKPGRLSQSEFEMIKTHTRVGYGILKDLKFPWPIARMVLQHHERINGSGYPYGLQGLDILLEARILSVADVVEAMSSNRPYRPAIGADLALEEIQQNKYILYDANVVEACLKCFADHQFNL
jgi:putative nucleotidyltransferase with HDIG domain